MYTCVVDYRYYNVYITRKILNEYKRYETFYSYILLKKIN